MPVDRLFVGDASREGRGQAPLAVAAPVRLPPGFDLVGTLGHGDFGVVHHVRRDGRDYAIKILHAVPGVDASRAARREAALLTCVCHPSLNRIHEVGEVEGRPYLTMDLIPGRTLGEVLRSGPLPPLEVARLGHDLARTLGAAHRAGIVHRDVKPDNVLITPVGDAVMIDFGLAGRDGETADGLARGTPAYCSPEQAGLLHRPVDGRSDLYSLGAVLFEAATGSPPFSAEDAGALLRHHLLTPPPDPQHLRPDLPPRLCQVLMRLLAKDPACRYPTGESVAAALEDVLGGTAPQGSASAPPAPVGRGAHASRLTAACKAALGGSGAIVVVQGPPGIGKRHLVRHVLEAPGRAGTRVLEGRCRQDQRPLAPLRDALDRHARELLGLDEPQRTAVVTRLHDDLGDRPCLGELSPGLATLLGLEVPDEPASLTSAEVVEVLRAVAAPGRGAVLHLVEAEHLDSATAAVLDLLRDSLDATPLLVVVSASPDRAAQPFRDLAHGAEGPSVIDLGPLDDRDVARLVAARLRGAEATRHLCARLATPAAGHPGAVLACVDAVIEAGLLRPHWGQWLLDEAGMDALSLPSSLQELVARRLGDLPASTRTVLTAAAVLGTSFDPSLLPAMSGRGEDEVAAALSAAAAAGVVESSPTGGTGFTHAAVTDALLASIPEDASRHLHRRAARARATGLDLSEIYASAARHVTARSGPVGVTYAGRRVPSAEVYALAHHVVASGPGSPREVHEAFLATRAAGVLALAEHAPYEAVELLDRMHGFAAAGGGEVDSLLWELTAIAYLRHGRVVEARDHFARALDAEHERWRRVRLRLRLAQCAMALFDTARCLTAVAGGIDDAGRPPARGLLTDDPRHHGTRGLGRLRRPRRGHSGAEDVVGRRYLTMLYCLGVSLTQIRPDEALRVARSAADLPDRAHPVPEDYILDSGRELAAAALGHTRRRRQLGERLSSTTLDSYGASTLAVRRALAALDADEDDRLLGLTAALAEHGRRLHLGDFLLSSTALLAELALRGRGRDLLAHHRRFWDQAGLRGLRDGHPYLVLAAGARAACGDRAGAAADLDGLRRASAEQPRGSLVHVRLLQVHLHTLLELGDLGEEFDATAATLTAVLADTAHPAPDHARAWAWLTAARVAACERASPEHRSHLLREADAAVSVLGRLPGGRLLRAHHALAAAWTAHLRGDDVAALDGVESAERWARTLDAPLITFEAARLRALTLRRVGDHASAARAAASARHVAEDQEWPVRARDVAHAFRIAAPGPVWRGASTTSSVTGENGLNSRRLQALQQVGLASAAVVEPHDLARIALDETMRILGAERAMLFLCESRGGIDAGEAGTPRGETLVQSGHLTTFIGRRDGRDIPRPTDYSATLVEKVAAEGRPLVVTGSAQGAALGSRSAVLHDLRSILIAPLHLKDRLIGVVYLDSRVASGIFTDEDVDILLAITHHVALALRTARAAQLAADVQAARRQRDVAELLRSSLLGVSAVQDPELILLETLRSAATLLHAQAYLLRVRGCRTVLAGHVEGVLEVDHEVDVGRLWRDLAPRGPAVLEHPPLRGLGEGEWLLLPMSTGAEQVGAIVAGGRSEAFTEAEVDLAAVLVEQNLAAYRNADLVSRLHRLATVDELTGAFTRRHFFERAAAVHEQAHRDGERVWAMMIDVDHFKRVNDAHGHAVGDEVLVEVARRLLAAAPPGCPLGRYGGEEFAVVTTASSSGAADALAQRLCSVVSAEPVVTAVGPVTVTVSVGVAGRSRDDELGTLFVRADQALYEAKQRGRNRVVRHTG